MEWGTLQTVALVVFGVVALILTVAFVAVALASAQERPFDGVLRGGYWFRRRWLGFLAAFVPVLVGVGALAAPYSDDGEGRVRVEVTSRQFSFSFDPPSVAAGSRVRFVVRSEDVTHGVGLYDAGGVLLGSVQAMPGYTNELDVTLDRPGTYRVLCFEFCGLGHHLMQGAFTVTES